MFQGSPENLILQLFTQTELNDSVRGLVLTKEPIELLGYKLNEKYNCRIIDQQFDQCVKLEEDLVYRYYR